MAFLLLATVYFLTTSSILVLAVIAYGWAISAKPYKGPVTDHFDGTNFHSLGLKEFRAEEAALGEEKKSIVSWLFRRQKNKWIEEKDQKNIRERVKPRDRVMGHELIVTFINHSTVLIQTEGLNILTDPIWSKYASPVSSLGPKRYSPPGIALPDLPPIDIILLSHNHYDHLDLVTLKRLHKVHKPRIYAHLGNAAYLKGKGIRGVADLDWGDRRSEINGVEIHSVPAQHFSSRGLADRNKTLWGGFVIRTKNEKGNGYGDIYFAGDSGYGVFVDRIASLYPEGFRFGIIPIGAYQPSFMMREVHMSPDEAVDVFKKLKVKKAMGIHFGTFKLADDGQFEPAERLKELMAGSNEFVAIKNGASLFI